MVSLGRNFFVSYLLVLLGVLLPIVPVFPHHHHEDGRICMKHDLPPAETPCTSHGGHSSCSGHATRGGHHAACGHATHGCHHEQSCMEADCLTTHFYRAGKSQSFSLAAPQTGDVEPMLFKTGLAGTLSLPTHYVHSLPHPTVEALFAADLPRTRGLRAPPQQD